ncbi:hypothetical protein ACHAXR_007620 [Thalassiosira sp. AJA248-18]
MLAVNIFPIALVGFGIWKVHEVRRDNYGCGDETPRCKRMTFLYRIIIFSKNKKKTHPFFFYDSLDYPDATWEYIFFCILLVTYTLELLIWPTIVVNKITRWMKSNKVTKKHRYATNAKGERLEQCLGGILKCVSVMCCNKAGGKELKNQGELKDFASNLMEFANNDTKVGAVLSDMYVGMKMLARVQAERRMNAIQMLQRDANTKEERHQTAEEEKQSKSAPSDRRAFMALLDSEDGKHQHRRSILTLQADGDGQGCVVVEKNVLSSQNKKDVDVLGNAAHYSIYAQYIYFHVRMALEDILPTDATNFVRDFDLMAPLEQFSLAKFELPYAHLFYANFYNGIAATPFAILVDDEKKTVVIAVRGTISLEDWVIDLQYVPQPLDKVGELCGFDGKGHHCHKGVLARAKWMYNDIKKRRVLKNLYSSESMYKDYNLVVVGHSLGGGCAQVLSLMLRPSFPSLRCYAFEPPGCIFDDVLSEDCKEWITSIVNHEDVGKSRGITLSHTLMCPSCWSLRFGICAIPSVPRVTQPNLESLRDEFFDVVARIKVPKYQVFKDVRMPCPESHLESRNAKVLCPKGLIEKDTQFYQQVRKFRNERAAKNQTSDVSVKLYIPGQIIYLVDTMGDETKYVPYWASRYEFNQVILSGRMLADHSMPPLVDVLRNLNLDEVHEVQTWHTGDKEEEDEDVEIPMIIPFSNPQGYIPLLLIAVAVIACIMAGMSSQTCQYFTRSATISDNGTSRQGDSVSVGLWAYNLKQCTDEIGCDTDDLEDSKYCQQYGKLIDETIDIYWKSARAFGSISALLGLISMGLISTATCAKLRKRTWIVSVTLFLIATLCQGLQFLFFKSDLCNEWIHPVTEELVSSECSISTGAIFGIVATILWFTAAVGCLFMASMAK